jgi:hypothetical protein
MVTLVFSTVLAVSQSVPAKAWQSAFVEQPGKQVFELLALSKQ